MKQVLQDIGSGKVSVREVPAPLLRDDGLLVRSQASLISAGTERMMMELAKKSLVGKARQRPDLVRKVLNKMRRDGFAATFKTVRDRLDREVPTGYSLCGEVVEVGRHAAGFQPGQAVACAGAGYANHAEVNCIPRLLAVPVPSGVSSEAAAYATVGAIALQGIRNAEVRVGEFVVVLGLGLIGQLTVQLLRASGCRVIGLDPAAGRVELASAQGAELARTMSSPRLVKEVLEFTRGRGADAVLITAATASNAPIELAAELARHRARVVMVGVTGMNIPRRPYFQKELEFVVSRSYGPGRYDPQYEEHGHDYPVGYVRWTENRNIEAFLDLVANGSIHPEVCTTHRFPIETALDAFELILTNREPHLGVVLTYPSPPVQQIAQRIVLNRTGDSAPVGTVGVSFIGAGNFARSVLLPPLVGMPGVTLRGIATASGHSARATGSKFKFAYCASSDTEILADDATAAVFVATQHSRHAEIACRALMSRKSVFVEKPLAIDIPQLSSLRAALEGGRGRLMVGYNRRFAPLAVQLKQFISGRGPMTAIYRCNAGPVPADHWTGDPAEGGRIIGEACHFVDLLSYLTDSEPVSAFAVPESGLSADGAAATLSYADGSVCQLIYSSAGSPAFSKERIEVFVDGRAGVLDDFHTLSLQAESGRAQRKRLFRPDKGHAAELAAFIEAVKSGGPMPIDVEMLFTTTLATFAIVRSLQRGAPVTLAELQAEIIADVPSAS